MTLEAELKKVEILVNKIWVLVDDNSGLSDRVVFTAIIAVYEKLLDGLNDDDYNIYSAAMMAILQLNDETRE